MFQRNKNYLGYTDWSLVLSNWNEAYQEASTIAVLWNILLPVLFLLLFSRRSTIVSSHLTSLSHPFKWAYTISVTYIIFTFLRNNENMKSFEPNNSNKNNKYALPLLNIWSLKFVEIIHKKPLPKPYIAHFIFIIKSNKLTLFRK
jgi:H+/gluconate symporter-like permease